LSDCRFGLHTSRAEGNWGARIQKSSSRTPNTRAMSLVTLAPTKRGHRPVAGPIPTSRARERRRGSDKRGFRRSGFPGQSLGHAVRHLRRAGGSHSRPLPEDYGRNAGSGQARHQVGRIDDDGSTQNLTLAWATYERLMQVNPVTANPFTTAELDALQAQLKSAA